MMRAVYTAAEVAKILGVSKGTVYNRVNSGELSAIRFGPKLIRIPAEAVEAITCPNTDSASTEGNGPSPTETTERRAAIRAARMIAL